jgi:myosin heavy subunit
MQVGNTLPTKRVSVVEGAQQVVRHFFVANLSGVLRKPAMAAVSLLAVIAGGSFMSVSAAERSLPGDFFYGLKLATEQAQLAMTSSKDDKLKLKTEFTTRRVSELKTVAASKDGDPTNNARVKQVAEILKSDLNTLKQQLSDVKQNGSSESVVAAAKLVDQKTNEVITALQTTKADMSPDAKAAVTDAQSAAADASVNAIEVLVEKHQESNNIVPVQDVTEAIQNHANAVASATQDSQVPLELQGSTSSTSLFSATTTVAAFVQTLSTSTTETVSSTAALPGIVDHVKDLTTQAFSLQKEKDQKDVQQAANAEQQNTAASSSVPLMPTDGTAPDGSTSTTTSSSPPVQ